MAEERKRNMEKDPCWVDTPAKQQQSISGKRNSSTRETEKAESNNSKTADEPSVSKRKPRQKMKRHRPKVVNENKVVKKTATPKPSTPTPKQVRKKKVVKSKKKAVCKRKLKFDDEEEKGNIVAEKALAIYEVSQVIKKNKRKMGKKPTLAKMVRLLGMIKGEFLSESGIITISWIHLKRTRSKMIHTRRNVLPFQDYVVQDVLPNFANVLPHQNDTVQEVLLDFANVLPHQDDTVQEVLLDFANVLPDQDDAVQEASTDFANVLPDKDDEVQEALSDFDNVLSYQDDAVQEALADFATQEMKSLCICDEVVKPVELPIVPVPPKQLKSMRPKRLKHEQKPRKQLKLVRPKRLKHEPKVDMDQESLRVWKLFLEGLEDTKEEKNNNDRNTRLEEERKLFVGRVDSFNAFMSHILGDRQFRPWKGSVVDSVVGVILTQNVCDNMSSNAFMDLTAKFPPPSLKEQNGGDENDYIVQEPPSPKKEESNPNVESVDSTTEAIPVEIDYVSSTTTKAILVETDASSSTAKGTPRKRNKKQGIKNVEENWDNLRKSFSDYNSTRRAEYNADTIDWKAVSEASVGEIASVIKGRGMSTQLAGRIKKFLVCMVRDHGRIDLEWLRNVPPLKAKSYLMSINGVALKSTECVRLLSLYQPSYPVDVNAARVLVRLGWVKLQPLPNGLPLHLLNTYPEMSKVQEYLWPRICNRDVKTLYEFHCYMNIFSKAFYTKHNPKCNACPMKGECKHFASALASSRILLDGTQVNNETSRSKIVNQERMITESAIVKDHVFEDHCEPILDLPASPEPETTESLESDMEDYGRESEIQSIILNCMEMSESHSLSSLDYYDNSAKSKPLFDPRTAQIPMAKIKNNKRLRTEHQVYVLPDFHPLLTKFEERDNRDHTYYLLAIWTTNSCQEPKNECDSKGESTGSNEVVQYTENEILKGTILIPCRTANRGRFPLNGTYFQINEVFADHDSSREPIDVPRAWLLDLPTLKLYCGTTITHICREMSFHEVVYCFREGYICIRGFDLKTRRSEKLALKFHRSSGKPVNNDQ